MHQFLKRAISGALLSLWIFSTMASCSSLFIISLVISLLIIWFFEWPKIHSTVRPPFLLYPLASFFTIIYLQLAGYKMLNFFIFISCFLFDTSAYLSGKLFGTHLIAPRISPGKTVEGFIAGYLTLSITYFLCLPYAPVTHTLLLAATISLLAFSGDLFESYLKRQSNLKDTGNVLPGHGGLLDRFDSILFVTIFVFVFRTYLIRLMPL